MRRVRRASQTVPPKVTSTRLPCWLLGRFDTIRGQSHNENLPACSFLRACPTKKWRRLSRDSCFKRSPISPQQLLHRFLPVEFFFRAQRADLPHFGASRRIIEQTDYRFTQFLRRIFRDVTRRFTRRRAALLRV